MFHHDFAAACEGLGLHELVIRHAKQFLKLQPKSELAPEARDMLKVAADELELER